MSDRFADLERAWRWREERGLFAETSALRVFHGPGEGQGSLAGIAIDRFGEHYWITLWEGREGARAEPPEAALPRVAEFLRSRGARSAVHLPRPERGVPGEPITLLGQPPSERFEVDEGGLRLWIRLTGVKHPGLFLDHAPLRRWLRARSRGWRVLNTFAYTGSLSVAAGAGGAAAVTTLDLSKPTLAWAEENWQLNELSAAAGDFIYGDVFEWIPRLARQGKRFDCVILDPPSFSRGHKGNFSTDRDLGKLHRLAFDVLAPGGTLITSINSASVTRAKFEADVVLAAAQAGRRFEVLSPFELPESFPTRLGSPADRYLKGWILRDVG